VPRLAMVKPIYPRGRCGAHSTIPLPQRRPRRLLASASAGARSDAGLPMVQFYPQSFAMAAHLMMPPKCRAGRPLQAAQLCAPPVHPRRRELVSLLLSHAEGRATHRRLRRSRSPGQPSSIRPGAADVRDDERRSLGANSARSTILRARSSAGQRPTAPGRSRTTRAGGLSDGSRRAGRTTRT
jgi:hypothetical protein